MPVVEHAQPEYVYVVGSIDHQRYTETDLWRVFHDFEAAKEFAYSEMCDDLLNYNRYIGGEYTRDDIIEDDSTWTLELSIEDNPECPVWFIEQTAIGD